MILVGSAHPAKLITDRLCSRVDVVAGAGRSRDRQAVFAESVEVKANRLGFVIIFRYQKRRESWSWKGCRIELDDPPHIGKFIEIEGPDEDTIRSAQSELGLDDVPHTRESYVRMLMEYRAK